MCEEAELTQAVVHRDDHRTLDGEIFAVVPGVAARSAREATAIDPHHHGTTIVGAICARPDVQRQAVFTWGRLTRGRRRSLRRRCGGSRAWRSRSTGPSRGAAASGRATAAAAATRARDV